MFLRGPENEFEYNYVWCSTLDSYEDHVAELGDRASAQHAERGDAFAGEEDGEEGEEDGEDGRRWRGKNRGGDDGVEKASVKRPVEHLSDIEIATYQVKAHRQPVTAPTHAAGTQADSYDGNSI